MYMSIVVHPKEITEVEMETLKENLSTAHKRIEHLTEVNNVHMKSTVLQRTASEITTAKNTVMN